MRPLQVMRTSFSRLRMLAAARALSTTRVVCAEASTSGSGASVASASTAASMEGAEKHSFQAETKQLLNIVANSLYTDRHVFIR